VWSWGSSCEELFLFDLELRWEESKLTRSSNSFLTGMVSTTCIVTIPLRYQAAAGVSALQAGIRLIPMSLTVQIGAMLVAVLTKKRRMPPIYLLFVGATLQMIGCIFLSRGSPDHPNWNGLYGFEAMTGIGVGITIGVVTLIIPYATEKRDIGQSSIQSCSRR
jgi:hypothetical protein